MTVISFYYIIDHGIQNLSYTISPANFGTFTYFSRFFRSLPLIFTIGPGLGVLVTVNLTRDLSVSSSYFIFPVSPSYF